MNPDSVSAQVPDIADGVSESTKASTTEVQTITSRKKTHAQRCREYRERKKLQNTMVQNITAERSDECSETDQLQAKKPKTNAERRKKHYEAQKLKKQKSKKIPKTVKQKNKEYYERKKKIRALNTLNHHSDAGGANMSSEHYECSVNSKTNIGNREKELENHFAVIHDIKIEIKEEPVEIKWLMENEVCDKSRQEEGQDRIFNELVPSNCEENPRESKYSLTHFWENTNFDTKGSEYISAADIEQIKKEIKVENVNEDCSESTDDFLMTNAELKRQILKTEDEIDIVYEVVKPEIHENKSNGKKSHPNTIANFVPPESSIDFGAGPQQNTTVEEDETDVERDNQKPLQCDFCSKSFPNSRQWKIHDRIHTREKPFQCNFCSKSFWQSSTLKNHERTHTGEAPFQCNFCSMVFIRSSTLKSHERSHTGEKPIQCNFCSKSFTENSTLKSHERIHTGEKPFRCNFCPKSFVQSSNKKRHERTHIGEK